MARFLEYVSKEYDNKQLTNLHTTIQQEALRVKSVALNVTLKEVNRIIYHTFAQILFITGNFGNFCNWAKVCRGYSLSHGSSLAVSVRNISPCSAVAQRIKWNTNPPKTDCPLLNHDFLVCSAFLFDFLMHVNNLNKSLQVKGTTVCFMHKKVMNFKDKCRLLKNHL